jgi:hypothetical protein
VIAIRLFLRLVSSDHAAILQRVYNFLCSVIRSDPRLL